MVRHFARKGCRVFALTSDPSRALRAERVSVIRCGWSPQDMAAALGQAREASVWIHAAARVDFAAEAGVALYEANALLSGQVARFISSEVPAGRLIYLSTIGVYGKGQAVSLEVDPRPDTPYGMSKLLGERLCHALLGPRCLALRLAGVWGCEDTPKLFINRCIIDARRGVALCIEGAGLGKRNYLWIGDIPVWMERGMSEEWSGVRLTASPFTNTIREMAQIIAERFGVELRIGDPQPGMVERDVVVPVPPGAPGTDFRSALALETAADG